MRRIVLGLVLISCAPNYLITAKWSARHLRGDCSPEWHTDPSDGWLWLGTGCGRTIWCSYDRTNEMTCGEVPNHPLPQDVETAAISASRCREMNAGREVSGTRWQVFGCGRIYECEESDRWRCFDRTAELGDML